MTTDLVTLSRKAELFRSLHRSGDPVLLVNVWDVETTRRVESAGAVAIATSSAAVNAARGSADDNTGRSGVFDVLGSIAAATSLPITADVEGGYGLSADELVEALVSAGAVGCNVEDSDRSGSGGLIDAERQGEYLRGLRAAADALGVPIVINARIDTIIQHPSRDFGAVFDETVRRARIYVAAGVDCVYPIGLGEPIGLSRLLEAGVATINVNPTAPVADLAAAGAARVSYGAGPFRQAMSEFERRARVALSGEPGAFS